MARETLSPILALGFITKSVAIKVRKATIAPNKWALTHFSSGLRAPDQALADRVGVE